MPIRVLVTDAESRKALACVRSLGRDHEVWTVSASRISVAGWSRWSRRHLVHAADDGFAEWLLDVATANRIDAIICPQEDTIVRVGRRYEAFEAAGIHLTFPPLDVLDLAFDKGRTLEVAAATGVPAPRTVALADLAEAEAAADTIGYPVVVKPRRSYYWNGSGFSEGGGPAYARAPNELRAAIAGLDPELPPPLVQAFVPGRGAGIFVLLAKDGTLSAAFAHRRLRDVHPTGSASVVRASAALDPALLEPSVALLRAMGLWGVAMVEYRIDERTGERSLMEVNARLWGSLQLAVDAGVDFPRRLVEVALGDAPPSGPYREGVVVRWWLGDLLRTLRVLRGRPPGFPGAFPGRTDALREFLLGRPRGMRNEIFRRDDPLPAVGELAWAALKRR